MSTIKITSYLSDDQDNGILAFSENIGFVNNASTGERCLVVKVTAGESINKGMSCVALIGGTSNKFVKTPVNGASHSMPQGVAYTAASGDNQTFWLAISGIVQILPEAGVTAAVGNVIVTSTSVAGRVAQYSTVPTSDHWDELGHFIETGSGAGALAKGILHFN